MFLLGLSPNQLPYHDSHSHAIVFGCLDDFPPNGEIVRLLAAFAAQPINPLQSGY
ncbi:MULTISPECIES: hypothetical protein [unclassified Anabaena]|uniref:hypothetical protein n=1 Tax=unclassified Anabaena TaxID=2619674 RepID=UPI0039C5E0E7